VNRKTIAFIIIALILLAAFRAGMLNINYYVSGYQGLDVSFIGVKYNGELFTNNHIPPNYNPSAARFDSTLNFDPDDTYTGVVNLGGEIRAIDVPETLYGSLHKVKEIKWDFSNETHKTIIYGAVYIGSFEFNIYLESDNLNFWDLNWNDEYLGYNDAEVWFIMVPHPFVGFVMESNGSSYNPYVTYFAPLYLQVENVEWLSSDPETQDLQPEVSGGTFAIYYDIDGWKAFNEEEVMKYKGKRLDPTIFRKQYYFALKLNRFYIPVDPVSKWVGERPSLKYKVKVHMLVIGEWILPLTEAVNMDLKPHQVQPPTTWWDFLKNLINNPFAVLGAGVGGLILLAIAFPYIISLLTVLLILYQKWKHERGGE